MFAHLFKLISLTTLLLGATLLPAQDLQWINGGSNSVGVGHEAVLLLEEGEVLVAGQGGSGIRSFSPLLDSIPPPGFSGVHLGRLDSTGQYLWVSSVLDSATSRVAVAQLSSTSVMLAAQIEGGNFDLGNGVVVSVPSGVGRATLLAKYNLANGLAQWAKLIPNSYELGDVAVAGGLIYLTGSYQQNFQIDAITLPDAPGTNPFVGITNGYVAAFDSLGTALWAQELQTQVNLSQTNFAFVTPTCLVSDGNQVYVAGNHKEDLLIDNTVLSQSTGGAFDSTDVFVAAFSSTGTLQWARSSVGASLQQANDLALTADGGLMLVGVHSSAFDLAGGTVSGVGKNIPLYLGGFALKLTALGQAEWSLSSTGLLYSAASNAQQGHLLGGYFVGDSGTVSLGATSLPAQPGEYAFLARVDSLGVLQWFTRGSTLSLPNFWWSGVAAIDVDDQGRVAAAGAYGQSMSWTGQATPFNGFNRDHYAAVFADSNWITPGPPPFPTDSVWPGDANYDLITNHFDVLAIGLAYGSTGPTRPNASLTYLPQPCYDWADTLPGGVNYKHADTDGNGLVDASDTLAVTLNYGLTHNRPAQARRTGPLLYPHFMEDSLSINDTAHIAIKLGTDTLQAEDVYGIAFTMNFDTSLVDFSTLRVSYDSSWLGTNGQDLLTLHRSFDDGQLDMVLTRTDQVDSSGFGTLAHLTIIMVDDLTAKTELAELLRLSISNVRSIDQNGALLEIATGRDSLVITQVVEDGTGTYLPEAATALRIYPQPTSRHLRVELSQQTAQGWTLFDLTGRRLAGERTRFQARTLALPQLKQGCYLLEIDTEQGTLRRRVLIQRP